MDQLNLPNIDETSLIPVDQTKLLELRVNQHNPKILALYGSLREHSFR